MINITIREHYGFNNGVVIEVNNISIFNVNNGGMYRRMEKLDITGVDIL